MEAMAQNHRAMADLLDDMKKDIEFQPAAFAPEKQKSIKDLVFEHFKHANHRHSGNREAIAKELGISSRTLYRYMKIWKSRKMEIA